MATQRLADDRVKGLLLDAYTDAFLLEHGEWFKSASRYPLAGKSRSEIRDLLTPEFEAWLSKTPLLGTAEGKRLAKSPMTVTSE